MEKRIRPWINKKIIEYIGEPEPTLVDFICSKVLGRSAPQSILDDVMMVIEDFFHRLVYLNVNSIRDASAKKILCANK